MIYVNYINTNYMVDKAQKLYKLYKLHKYKIYNGYVARIK